MRVRFSDPVAAQLIVNPSQIYCNRKKCSETLECRIILQRTGDGTCVRYKLCRPLKRPMFVEEIAVRLSIEATYLLPNAWSDVGGTQTSCICQEVVAAA